MARLASISRHNSPVGGLLWFRLPVWVGTTPVPIGLQQPKFRDKGQGGHVMSNRKSKAQVLVVPFVDRDEHPLRPIEKRRRATIAEGAGVPLLHIDEALAWANQFNRGEIRRPMGAWAVVRRGRVRGGRDKWLRCFPPI
jgi:hypothetical protein